MKALWETFVCKLNKHARSALQLSIHYLQTDYPTAHLPRPACDQVFADIQARVHWLVPKYWKLWNCMWHMTWPLPRFSRMQACTIVLVLSEWRSSSWRTARSSSPESSEKWGRMTAVRSLKLGSIHLDEIFLSLKHKYCKATGPDCRQAKREINFSSFFHLLFPTVREMVLFAFHALNGHLVCLRETDCMETLYFNECIEIIATEIGNQHDKGHHCRQQIPERYEHLLWWCKW